MATLAIRSIHHFQVSKDDKALAALWPQLVAPEQSKAKETLLSKLRALVQPERPQGNVLDMDFALSFIERFKATQMNQHPTMQFNNNASMRVTGFSTPSAPNDLTRSMVVYMEEDERGDYVPKMMTIGKNLNFVMFYATTCCSSSTASSLLGMEYNGNYEMLCADAAQGVKQHMHGLFMPDKIRVTRAEANQFDKAALASLSRRPK